MNVLFLDDSPVRHRVFKQAIPDQAMIVYLTETYRQAVQALDMGPRFDEVHLDRDLNDYGARSMSEDVPAHELTGEHIAEFIANMPKNRQPLRVIVHTLNPDAGHRMVQALVAADVAASYHPFGNPRCDRCKTSIRMHTGDGRVDGTGYICPETKP